MKFSIPIGDWSGDGHGQCDYYYFEGNKTMEELREAYFASVEKYPKLDPNKVCGDYQESKISKEEYDFLCSKIPALLEEEMDMGTEHGYPDDEFMCTLVLEFIKLSLPDFTWTKDAPVPMIPFYGFDSKERHIGFWGYGIKYA